MTINVGKVVLFKGPQQLEILKRAGTKRGAVMTCALVVNLALECRATCKQPVPATTLFPIAWPQKGGG